MNARAISQKAIKAAESYVSWMSDAGADIIVDDTVTSWLEKRSSEEGQESKANSASDIAADNLAPTDQMADTKQAQASKFEACAIGKAKTKASNLTPKADFLPVEQWPQTPETLRKMIVDGNPLPGALYSKDSLSPVGDGSAKYFLLLDIPEREDISAGHLASGAQGILLKNMMAAIGIDLSDCYITALALSRPATGMLPDTDLAKLAEFVRHQIGMMNPEGLFLFGSSASTALLGAELMKARGILHYFNHNDQNVAALTTFHPRTLLARPQMKAQAWRDLQLLIK